LPDDLFRAERQLVDEDDRGDRRALDHADRLVGDAWQDRAHRLRQDDAAEGKGARHTKSRGCDGLVTIHRSHAAADDFGAERGFVQCEAENGRGEGVEPDSHGREDVIDEHQLQQERRAPDEPNVKPRRSPQRRVAGEPQQGEAKPQQEPERHRHHRELQGE